MNYNFYIDPIRRTVTPEAMTVLWLDQDVTTIHFSVEDFEGFTFDGSSILIKAVLPDRTQVEITPDNFTTEPITTEDDEGQTVITGYSTSFDWTLTLEHTKAVGLLTYSICAIMLNLDGETVDKEWHTLNDSFQIRDHIHFNGSDDQDDPVTAATNAEKIAALKAQVDGLAGGVKTVGAVSQMTDHSVAYVYTGTETGYTRGNWYYWSGTAWVSGGTYGGAVTDTTLSVAGTAADAKAVGDAMAGIGAASVPTEVRQAMKTLFEKAAYIEEGLADEVAVITAWAEATTSITVSPSTVSVSSASPTAQLSAVTTPAGKAVTWSSSNTAVATVSSAGLVTAVGNGTATITATSGTVSASCAVTVTGFSTLTGIEAVYTQSGTVYDTASLDDLKADLVVTGTYDDTSTATITGYTLSGTLTAGTSTVTVSYGGKTDTFTVTVTSASTTEAITWSGSGAEKTSSIIDGRNGDVFFTLPFVSGSAQLVEGTTADSEAYQIRGQMYSDAECTQLVGYWYPDSTQIETSTRTWANSPKVKFDTEVKLAIAGYYVKFVSQKSGTSVFSSNGNYGTYINANGTSATVKAVGGN